MNKYVAISLKYQPQKKTNNNNSAISDSGLTGNFMAVYTHLNNLRPTAKMTNKKFPNRQIIRSSIKGELNLPMSPNISRQSHNSPNIKHSIVSIGTLCDAGCAVTFKILYVTVIYKDNIILQGWRNHQNECGI